jgi:hypothetical protein
MGASQHPLFVCRAGDPQIAHEGAHGFRWVDDKQDVAGLEIAMKDPAGMQVRDRGAGLTEKF